MIHEPGKFDPRSEEGTLLGYAGSCGRGGARIRLKSDNRVIITGNVRHTPLPEPGAPDGELACLTAAPRAHEPAYVFDDVLTAPDVHLDYCFITLAPSSLKQAFKSPDKARWVAAECTELDGFE